MKARVEVCVCVCVRKTTACHIGCLMWVAVTITYYSSVVLSSYVRVLCSKSVF